MNEENKDIKEEIIEFSGKNIPIAEAAKIMDKTQQFIRLGIQEGWLPIGIAHRKDGAKHYDYYISPKMFYEVTGHIYKG